MPSEWALKCARGFGTSEEHAQIICENGHACVVRNRTDGDYGVYTSGDYPQGLGFIRSEICPGAHFTDSMGQESPETFGLEQALAIYMQCVALRRETAHAK